MKFKAFNPLVKVAGKVGTCVKHASPEILVVAGIVGLVVATVEACKSTKKAEPIIEDHERITEEIKEDHETGEISDKEYRKELFKCYASTGIALSKVYLPSLMIGVASICAILFSHHMLRVENMRLSAALAAITKTFDEYRQKVSDRFGADVENSIYNAVHDKLVPTEEAVDKETGEIIDIPKNDTDFTVKPGDEPLFHVSQYSSIFDKSNPNWKDSLMLDEDFLIRMQNHFNDAKEWKYVIWLNYIQETLRLPLKGSGQFVGYFDDPHSGTKPSVPVDLRIQKAFISQTREISATQDEFHSEPCFVIDPNVTYIYDKVFKSRKEMKKGVKNGDMRLVSQAC